MEIPWIIIAIVMLLILLGIVAIIFAVSNKKKRPTDYYALFVMGAIWLPFGIIMSFTNSSNIGNIFFILGLVYSIIGLANKDKWKKNRVTWKKLTGQEKRARGIIMGILILLLLFGIIMFFIFK